jgi:hypothetical protein
MPRVSFTQLFAGQSLRNLSDLTGGMASGYTPSDKTLARIDRASRFQYLLGYAPANATWDGRFRRISVKVNRKDVRVLFRHGYYARPEFMPFDRRQFLTYNRIAAAGNVTEPIADLKVSGTVEYTSGAPELVVTLTIAAHGIAFSHADGHHTASLEVAFFAGNAKQVLVGEDWQAVDLDLTDANYELFKSKGVSYTQHIPLKGEPRFLKIIAYDYAADAIGTAMIAITTPAK